MERKDGLRGGLILPPTFRDGRKLFLEFRALRTYMYVCFNYELIERRKRDVGIHNQKLLDYRPASFRKLHSVLLLYPLHLLMRNLCVEKKTCFKSLKNKYMAMVQDTMWDLEEYCHMTWTPEIL